ncbi:hypothetical protein HDU93_003416, partial [Gonapodya sp. JEL0774]
NDALIDAVEKSDLTAVLSALTGGADPNARKRVTLACFVYEGSKWTTPLFSRTPTEKPVGAFTTLNEATLGESALGLAILQDNAALVRLLLDHGADPTLPVEWKIIRGRTVWTLAIWNNIIQRGTWDIHYKFGSALELALGEGIAMDPMGESRIESLGATSRELWINKPGFVMLLDPGSKTTKEETFRTVQFIPNLQILDILLRHNQVRVTPTLQTLIASCANHPELLRKLHEATNRGTHQQQTGRRV